MADVTLAQALSFATQAMLLLVALLTTIEFVRRRGQELLDIALMFASLGVTTIVAWIGFLGYKAPWLTIFSGVALCAHPFLIVRVGRHFRPVPWAVNVVLVAGMVASWGYIVWSTLTAPATGTETPRTGWGLVGVLAVLAYFAFGELYAAAIFVRGSRQTAGVARRRLGFAALGAALLGLLFLVASVGIVRPSLADSTQLVTQPLAVLFILSWYAGFAPPRWLRRAWQLEEVQRYLAETGGRSVDERAARSVRRLREAAMRLLGAPRASIVQPHGDSWDVQILYADGHESAADPDRIRGSPMTRAFETRKVIIDHAPPPETASARAKGSDVPAALPHTLYIPLWSELGVRGLLVVPLERVPLFLEESIEVLRTLCDQAAVTLDMRTFAHEQEELRLRQARLATEELRRQNLAMQEATRLKSEFLANMSHELRTPLNGIIGFADLMASGKVGPVNPDHEEFVGDILTSARHLLQLINDVLDLAKVEAGRLEFRPERFDPRRMIEESLVVVRPLAQRKGIHLHLDTEEAPVTVDLDAVRFKQMVYNYVSNAIKFTPDGGRVSVRVLAEPGERIRVEVEDTGVGIAAHDIPKLFHEFQQLDAGMAKHHQGTGLGLALVRRLVEAQGGAVGVQSVVGKGSTFHASLPVASGAIHPAEASTDAPLVEGARVLVVDDDARDREGIASVLRAQGYHVDTAATGAEALRLVAERAYDAATVDLILPDLHGYDLVKALRESAGGARVAVLIVTQLAKENVHVAYPVEGIFQKPVDPATLAEALERAGAGPTSARPVLVVDDDPTMRRLVETHLRAMGYRSVLAADGIQALDAIKREPPALIVLDLVMPRMDGFAFLAAYRRAGGGAPVLVWTSKDLTDDERARLQGQVQVIAYKADGGSFTLASRLEEALKRR